MYVSQYELYGLGITIKIQGNFCILPDLNDRFYKMIPHGALLHVPQNKLIALRVQIQQQQFFLRCYQYAVRVHIAVTLIAEASVELFELMEQFLHPLKQERFFHLFTVLQPVDQQFTLHIIHCRPAASSMLYKL